MRDRTGRLKVLDFGLAYSAEADGLAAQQRDATLPGVLVGTPAYMAPEQLNGQRADARADVFAYGVVMYEYACGVASLRCVDAAWSGRHACSKATRRLSRIGRHHIPAHVAMVVDRCLRKSARRSLCVGRRIS